MIKVSVVTEIEFENEQHLESYLSGDQVAIVTGFSDEIRKAYETRAPLKLKTNRPKFGIVTKSEIKCEVYE